MVRSCAFYPVRFFADSEDFVWVRTYRVPAAAKLIPFRHHFMFSDWFEDDFARELTPGTVGFGPRGDWDAGKTFPVGWRRTNHICGEERLWREGGRLDRGDQPLVWQEAGPSTCCWPVIKFAETPLPVRAAFSAVTAHIRRGTPPARLPFKVAFQAPLARQEWLRTLGVKIGFPAAISRPWRRSLGLRVNFYAATSYEEGTPTPACELLTGGGAAQYTFTIGSATNGFCSDCANVNRTYTLSYVSGCRWEGEPLTLCGSTVVPYLQGSPGEPVESWTVSIGAIVYQAWGDWNGSSPLVLSMLGTGGTCATLPPSITVSPV